MRGKKRLTNKYLGMNQTQMRGKIVASIRVRCDKDSFDNKGVYKEIIQLFL